MKKLKLFVVDDDEIVLKSIKMCAPDSWNVELHNSANSLPNFEQCHVGFVDIHLSGDLGKFEGIELLKKIHSNHPNLELVAISGTFDRDLMEQSLVAGASRFVAKPILEREIKMILDKQEAYFLLQDAHQRHSSLPFKWIGNSQESQKIKKQISLLRGEKAPVLICGESGSGKEIVARLLNQQEGSVPFIAINAASISESLFESELFGHKKGAFTGADQNKMGLVEAANSGDLFLDEVDALSLPSQAKLLRFLETKEYRRVGSEILQTANTRIICATNQNLNQLVEKKQFREDLLWRIKGQTILVPPLRERLEDIALLCQFFFSLDQARQKVLAEDGINALKKHQWPGNVRELKRICEQLQLYSPLPMIRERDVLAHLNPSQYPTTNITESHKSSMGLEEQLEQAEIEIIQSCLNQVKNIDEAAKLLKMSRSNLYKKIRDLQINWRN